MASNMQWLNAPLDIAPTEHWYDDIPQFTQATAHQPSTYSEMIAKVELKIRDYIAKSQAIGSKLSSDEKWMKDVIESGTLSDKIAALALKVQQSPILELISLDMILSFASQKEQRPAQLALEALKDLFIHTLLPDRKLIPLRQRPLDLSKMTPNLAARLWFEDKLIDRYKSMVTALQQGLRSTIDHFKKTAMSTVKDLLTSKPEQENKLLEMLVNKLGDPSTKVSTYAVTLLKEIAQEHAAMRSFIVREVRQLMNHSPSKVVYVSVLFLSQIPLHKGDNEVALQLVETFIGHFERSVKEDTTKSKLQSALLVGINRSFPFLEDKRALMQYIDPLFKLSAESNLLTSTQALVLISYIVLDMRRLSDRKQREKANEGEVSEEALGVEKTLANRFYRALYHSLGSDQVRILNSNQYILITLVE